VNNICFIGSILVVGALWGCGGNSGSSNTLPQAHQEEDRKALAKSDADRRIQDIHKLIEEPVIRGGYEKYSKDVDALARQYEQIRDWAISKSREKEVLNDLYRNCIRENFALSWVSTTLPSADYVSKQIIKNSEDMKNQYQDIDPEQIQRFIRLEEVFDGFNKKSGEFKALVSQARSAVQKTEFAKATDDDSVNLQLAYFLAITQPSMLKKAQRSEENLKRARDEAETALVGLR